MTTQRERETAWRALRRRADEDRGIVGFFVGGSRGKHFETAQSDYDCYVVVGDDDVERYEAELAPFTPMLDLHVRSLSWLRDSAVPWDRYNYVDLVAEVDRVNGEIQRLLDARASLSAGEAESAAQWALPAYANAVYRSLKSANDGRILESRLDAAEGINYFLTALFSIYGRVRPYNKYLRWELDRRPIPEWDSGEMLADLERVLATGDLGAQRDLFRKLERVADTRGHADALRDWRHTQLAYMRGDRDSDMPG